MADTYDWVSLEALNPFAETPMEAGVDASLCEFHAFGGLPDAPSTPKPTASAGHGGLVDKEHVDGPDAAGEGKAAAGSGSDARSVEELTKKAKKAAKRHLAGRGWPHMAHFLLPTKFCDADHPDIVAKARELVPVGAGGWKTATTVRDFVRDLIDYSFEPLNDKASETLVKRKGMCTNMANLTVALMRAAGLPAGYVICHITKDVYKGGPVPDEMWEVVADPTVHCFAVAYIPEARRWTFMDSTGRSEPGSMVAMKELPTGESVLEPKWMRGPFGGPQGNMDSIMAASRSGRHNAMIIRTNEALAVYWEERRKRRAESSAETTTTGATTMKLGAPPAEA